MDEVAEEMAREVLEGHVRVGEGWEWNAVDHRWDPSGPVKPWCNNDEHDAAAGGPWPCDAVKLARIILGDPNAGGPDA